MNDPFIVGVSINLLSLVFAYCAYLSFRRLSDTEDVQTIKGEGALTRALIVGATVAYCTSLCYFYMG